MYLERKEAILRQNDKLVKQTTLFKYLGYLIPVDGKNLTDVRKLVTTATVASMEKKTSYARTVYVKHSKND